MVTTVTLVTLVTRYLAGSTAVAARVGGEVVNRVYTSGHNNTNLTLTHTETPCYIIL